MLSESATGAVARAWRATSGALAAHDHNTLDGQNGVVSVDGFARY